MVTPMNSHELKKSLIRLLGRCIVAQSAAVRVATCRSAQQRDRSSFGRDTQRERNEHARTTRTLLDALLTQFMCAAGTRTVADGLTPAEYNDRCSNPCATDIVGDQLTARSTTLAYRRQLLQGHYKYPQLF